MNFRSTAVPAIDVNWRHGVIHLASWPQLATFPADLVPSLTRICALLARRPANCSLIALRLNLSLQTTNALLEELHLGGHIFAEGSLTADTPDTLSQPITHDATPTLVPTSLWGKIWLRLVGKR